MITSNTNNPFPEGSLERLIVEGAAFRLAKGFRDCTQDIYDATGMALRIRFEYEMDGDEVVRFANYLRENPIVRYIVTEPDYKRNNN